MHFSFFFLLGLQPEIAPLYLVFYKLAVGMLE